jgi:hypothetical protein
VSTLLKFSYACDHLLFILCDQKYLYFNYDGCEEIFLICFKCMKCVVPGHFSGTFSK